ncbi:MAG: hypothetical protein AAGJ83_03985 [Planctomycetota bacterium]
MLCLRLGTFLCFAGWAWVHYYWEAPYGSLLWDDSTFELAEALGISWDEFVGSGADDGWVQTWIGRLVWPYVICAVLSLTARRNSWLQLSGLLCGSGFLVLLSYAKYAAAQRQLPMFVEHGGQMLMPVIFVMALTLGVRHRVTVVTACLALAMTFAGHGSYAVDLWPTPSTFFAMTSVILGVGYDTAKTMLFVAGILDFAVCLAILIPGIRRWAALYAAAWGLLTALARPFAGMSFGLIYWGADQFLHETVLRSPHFMAPLYLFLIWSRPAHDDSPTKEA